MFQTTEWGIDVIKDNIGLFYGILNGWMGMLEEMRSESCVNMVLGRSFL